MRELTRRAAILCGLALAATACTASAETDPAANAQVAEGYPVAFTNCGADLAFDQPPERVVSLYPGMTEQLIALGLTDHLIAQSGVGQGDPLEEYRDEFDAVTSLGDGSPSMEILLVEDADLLLAEGTYHFDGTALPTREELADHGMQTYVSQPLCPDNKTRSTIEDALADFQALGDVFGVPDRAAILVDDFRRRLATVENAVAGREPVRAVVTTVYEDRLYIDAGGLYTDVLTRAGAENITPQSEMPTGEYYAQVSPEVVLRGNPETIVFTYLGDEDRAAAERFLRDRFAQTDAVANDRLIAMPETTFSGGVHSVPGIEDLARELHPDAF